MIDELNEPLPISQQHGHIHGCYCEDNMEPRVLQPLLAEASELILQGNSRYTVYLSFRRPWTLRRLYRPHPRPLHPELKREWR